VARTNTIPADHCPVCCRPVAPAETCPNPLCGWGDRYIRRVEAVCLKTGPIDRLLRDFKYGRVEVEWADIFGRLLFGWLAAHHDPRDYDLIVVNPTHESRKVRHTELMLAAAARHDDARQWPFDRAEPAAIVKTHETPPSAFQPWRAKKVAADRLRGALHIPDRSRIAGQRILVIDDIATTMLQLNAIAGVLRMMGDARSVDGLVLARAVLGLKGRASGSSA
jgi:predicted amidophosphoribosyltransferase